MLFNSVFFLTVFLPLSLLGWYMLQKLEDPVYAKIFLFVMSLWFYGYYNIRYLWVLVGSLFFNFLFSIILEKIRAKRLRQGLFLIGLFGNIGLLFYFKYFGFFLDNCNYFLHTNIQIEKIALPLGISFFTFQQISFLADRYSEKAPHYSFLDYACFITYFPQLIAGPIVLHSELVPQLLDRRNRKPDVEMFFDGFTLFILGLSKKVLLADTLALLVNSVYDNIAIIPYYIDGFSGWITIICYMLELYFDFSGYSDMARGIGKMFGFQLPENFHSPLHADSVRDFWRRWHMTLTRFLTTYIYIPLGGNQKGRLRQCLNTMLVFLISGLWHGANWTFIIWGLLHGIAMVWETCFPRLRFRSKRLNRLVTFLYVTLTFSIFRSDSLSQSATLLRRMFTIPWTGYFVSFCRNLQLAETFIPTRILQMQAPVLLNLFYIFCVILLLLTSHLLVRGRRAEEWIARNGGTTRSLIILAFLFVWSTISLSEVSTFLYFNF